MVDTNPEDGYQKKHKMPKAFKIITALFFAFALALLFFYWKNHDTNEKIFELTKTEIEQKEQSYLSVYNFLKNNTTDSFPTCNFSYRRGDSFINFTESSKNGRDRNSYKETTTFINSIGRTFSASFNSNNEMNITFDHSNFKLDRTHLKYSPDIKKSIDSLKAKGYLYFGTFKDKREYTNCCIKVNESWVLVFTKNF